MLAQLPPAVWFGLAALMVPILPQAIRGVAILAVPVVSLVHMFWLIGGWPGDGWTGSSAAEVVFLGETLTFFRLDSLSLPFAILFHLAAFVGLVYSIHVKDTVQQVSALLYAGSAVGSACAGDLLSLLIMWEVLTVSSVFLIWARRTTRARNAALRYFLFQLLSGVLLLNGIAWMASSGKSLEFGAIPLDSIPAWCLLIGFGLKAGFPLLHSWIIDGYPQGTVTGTLFLSGLTSKVAIYALARGFAGTDLLVTIGTVMAVWPIFFAVIENDLRRVLSYSMINQLGFMVVGIGIGTDLAINGAVAHAFNDVFFKGLLFMAMGAVLFRTGTANGTDLGGLYKTMPKTTGLCLIGAASISAVPLFSGFVSKGMIMTAVMEEHHTVIWCLLLFAAAGVVEHAGIKIPYFAFFAHDSGKRPKEAPRHMLAAMTIAAIICIFNGVAPGLFLYEILPRPIGDFIAYDMYHVTTQLQLLCFASLAVVVLMITKVYPPEVRAVNLDSDWLLRRPGKALVLFAARPAAALARSWNRFTTASPRLLRRNPFPALDRLTFLEETVLVVVLLLLSFLVVLFYS